MINDLYARHVSCSLAVQAARVCIFQSVGDLKPSALESVVSEGTPVTLTGTVSRIEEKAKVTAVSLDDNAVSALGQQISEPKLLVYINPDEIETKVNRGNVIQVEGEVSLFDQARNPGILIRKPITRGRACMCSSGRKRSR